MSTQLILLDTPEPDWSLDAHTRQVGFKGIAAARAELEAARLRALEAAETGDGPVEVKAA